MLESNDFSIAHAFMRGIKFTHKINALQGVGINATRPEGLDIVLDIVNPGLKAGAMDNTLPVTQAEPTRQRESIYKLNYLLSFI